MESFKIRMANIPVYAKVEHFNRSWFEVSKMTASNYRDMVCILSYNNGRRD